MIERHRCSGVRGRQSVREQVREGGQTPVSFVPPSRHVAALMEADAQAKELLAGLAGAAAEKLFETKGLDFLDRERAKREAIKQGMFPLSLPPL